MAGNWHAARRRRACRLLLLSALASGASAGLREDCIAASVASTTAHHQPSLCGATFATSSAAAAAFSACMKAGGGFIGHVSEEWLLSLAQQYGGLSQPCGGSGSSAANILPQLASLHNKLGAIQVATPFLSSPQCRPQSLGSCAVSPSSVAGADPSFEQCPSLQPLTTCATSGGSPAPAAWSTPDAGSTTSVFDVATVNVSRPLASVDLNFVDMQQALALSAGVNDASNPGWTASDVAAVSAYLSTPSASPIIVTVSFCRALEAHLAGCTASPAVLYYDATRGLCVYRTKPPASAATPSYYSPSLGLYVTKPSPQGAAAARSAPYAGVSCSAKGPRTSVLITGVSGANWVITDPGSDLWFLVDPLKQVPASTNVSIISYGSVALSGPHAIATGAARGTPPAPPLTPITAATLAAAGFTATAGASGALAAASVANAWSPVDATIDSSLYEALTFLAVRALERLRGHSLVLQFLQGVACRVVDIDITGSATRVCRLQAWLRDPSFAADALGGVTAENPPFADNITISISMLANKNAGGTNVPQLPAFLARAPGAAEALSAVGAVVAWTPNTAVGEPAPLYVPPTIPQGLSPMTAEEVSGIQWSLVFYAIIVGIVLFLGIWEYLRRTANAASVGYIPVTVVGTAGGASNGYSAGYPSSDPYAAGGGAMGGAPGVGGGFAARWRGAEPLDFDRIPDPAMQQGPYGGKRQPRVTDW